MENYYLAVDIGASSGRHILGTVKDGTISLEEIYRFENGMEKRNGHLCWDVESLFHEIKMGMKQCAVQGKIPCSMGIDTWAVDFVLLDRDGQRLGDAVGYRDDRTKGMDEKVYEVISPEALYERTGIQKQIFNTIYQLMAMKEEQPEALSGAESLLMIPDYFHYMLTGVKRQEYTNATTTQLVSPVTKTWDYELIRQLGYPEKLFTELSMPGTVVGTLTKAVQDEVGFNCKVVLPATHDTGSAVMAVPVPENGERKGHETEKTHDTDGGLLYISSGTWSLMGTELSEADCSAESRKANLTNEGGYEYRFRYLKNIMGLWIVQCIQKQLGISFAEMVNLARTSHYEQIFNVNDPRFSAPEDMAAEIRAALSPAPETDADLIRSVYVSLAHSYGEAIRELEHLTSQTWEKLYIAGGGAKNALLNELTAQYTGKEVVALPIEATALGNLKIQREIR